MHHIRMTDGFEFGDYFAYLDSIRDRLPAHVYAFASDPRHYDLTSHSSLHDAWLESVTVREASSGERHEVRRIEIVVSLLGPFHDLRTQLVYTGVTRYSFDAPPRYGEPRYEHTGHGDLLTHEVRLGHEGLIVHEILFERDATLLIECLDIRHSEQPVVADGCSEPEAAIDPSFSPRRESEVSRVVWLENHAGPLLFLPVSLLSEWSGIDDADGQPVSFASPRDPDEPSRCDYDRACDVDDYAAPIRVGYGEGLVLNDEPCRTTWMPRSWGGLFARWEFAESETDMVVALEAVPDDLDWETKGEIRIVGSAQSLFNSAELGVQPVYPRLGMEVAAGLYSIRWTRYQPDPSTAVGLIELRRVSD